MSVSKNKHDLILKWHDAGYSVNETANLLKITPAEIIAIIDNRGKEQENVPQLHDSDNEQLTLQNL